MENGSEFFLRQLSVRSSPCYHYNSSSTKRRGSKKKKSKSEMEEEECENINGMSMKKRVMVVIDQSTKAKHAMMWALTHIVNRGDILTLLHVVPPPSQSASNKDSEYGPNLANSLGSLCKACKPEVEVEALVVQGPKLATVLSQVKKLEASVLVLSKSKPSLFSCLFRSSSEDFVEQCINRAQCLTMAVRKQSKGVGGYLVSTRWQKNFWLLA